MERFEGNDLMSLASFIDSTAFGVLNNFLSEFHGEDGYALPSRYEVLITPPRGAPAGASLSEKPSASAARKVSINCESISMPGKNLNTSIDNNIYGVPPEIVDGINFGGAVNMTFQASSDMKERVFFQQWQEQAWDRATWNIGYYDEYASGSVEIYIVDQQNNKRFGIKLMEAYPKEINGNQLDAGPAQDIVKQVVQMQYRYWESLDITANPKGLLEKIADTVLGGAERSINAAIPKVLSRL